jgi:hypothetical protein
MTGERDPGDELEVVDGQPVLTSDDAHTAVDRPQESGSAAAVVPARQVAAMVATGVAAGAATVALVHRHRSRSPARRIGRKKGRPALGEIVTSSSFLVDVHLIRKD